MEFSGSILLVFWGVNTLYGAFWWFTMLNALWVGSIVARVSETQSAIRKYLWKREKLFGPPSSQLKPFLKEWMYHHIAKISFRRYIMRLETHAIFGATYSPTPTISCSSGTCDFIQLCFSVKSMLLFVWPKRESIWSMSSHERQLCGGASSSSKSDVKLLVNRDAQRITVNHGESRWITLVFCREPVSYGRITPNHAQSRSITLPIVKGIL